MFFAITFTTVPLSIIRLKIHAHTSVTSRLNCRAVTSKYIKVDIMNIGSNQIQFVAGRPPTINALIRGSHRIGALSV